jgi:hypothetical protein
MVWTIGRALLLLAAGLATGLLAELAIEGLCQRREKRRRKKS